MRKVYQVYRCSHAHACAVPQAGMQCISTERVSALSRYIKIAATLPEKSVRDVALRVRWMMRKDAPRKPRHKVRLAMLLCAGMR